MNDLLLFVGLVVLTAAFFSFDQPLLRRLGVLCVALTTFAAGYLLTRNLWVGLAFASGWLVLPWIEILLRVRKLRLPLRKELRQATPPSREMFPALNELSDEIESAGFEHVADLGWDMEGYRQFLRLFANPDKREEAAITYVEQNQLGFHFASVTSRGADGAVFTTWNCPVSSSLKTPPTVHLHRVGADADFATLVSGHEEFCGSGDSSAPRCNRSIRRPCGPRSNATWRPRCSTICARACCDRRTRGTADTLGGECFTCGASFCEIFSGSREFPLPHDAAIAVVRTRRLDRGRRVRRCSG